jgi:hypothetical protein
VGTATIQMPQHRMRPHGFVRLSLERPGRAVEQLPGGHVHVRTDRSEVSVLMVLTYRQAAARVDRSVRTIKRWRRGGMQMDLDGYGRRVVDEEVLLAWWRSRLQACPTHQYRMRRAAASSS